MDAATRITALAITSPAPRRRRSAAGPLAGGLLSFPSPLRRRYRLRLRASSDAAGRESGSVDVIAIGSRKDALIDFCLGSSLAPSSRRLRFWTIHARDSQKIQLLRRCHGTDAVLKNVEFPLSLDVCPPAIILVASAGHGSDHITAAELLDSVKSAGGLAVAILLKPFGFEGQRRQKEVHNMENQLRECSHFYIVVEADSLLKTEAQTLAEALESANNAVFLAMDTISLLMSDKHLKFLDLPDEHMREIETREVVNSLENYREAKVGFGAGYNIKAAIVQAVFHCPFLSGSIKDMNGLVLFSVASACTLDKNDSLSVILTFRRVTGYTGEIIFSRIHEPDLEPNLVVTTILIVSSSEKIGAPKQNFLSSLSLHFPFIFSLLGGDSPETKSKRSVHFPSGDSAVVSTSLGLSGSANLPNTDLVNGDPKFTNVYSEEIETAPLGNYEELSSFREPSFENKSSVRSSECSHNEEVPSTQMEGPSSWNMGPEFQIAQLLAKKRTSLIGTNNIDRQDIFTLPVGVKSIGRHVDHSPDLDGTLEEMSDGTKAERLCSPSLPSGDELTDAWFDPIINIYNSTLTILKGRSMDQSEKRGLLSVRAASMLDSERDSQKSWTPVMELQYRGGTYRGRCQGGLPEGKGHLTYVDGSFYDGMWRFGKRSGLGTFCYSNGDVFQGSWRDDLMHGKGWFYFHTGDRWFANFWKGKANGECRFYSKNGSTFFGHFKDGWRHGRSLCIDVDGSRWTEIWNDGVLVKRTELDSEACG